LVLNGRLYRGRRGMAGELGHVQVDPAGPRCNCGAAGCAETYLSGAGLVRLTQDVLAQRPDSSLHARGARLGARDVFAAARQGDEVARAIIDRFASRLTRLLYATQLTYDVEAIVLGGGVAKAGGVLMNAVQRQIAALRTRLPLARTMLDPERISAISDQNMGVWGGIMLAADARLNEEKTDHDRHPAVSLDQEQPLS
jgi:glucokinase